MALRFNQACYRSDMTRHVREDNIYDFESCPCVVEFRTCSALLTNYHKRNPELYVLPGAKGVLLQGLRVDAVHFNTRFVKNYHALHSLDLRSKIYKAGGCLECMCGGRRQLSDFSTCGAVSFDPWNDFIKLGRYRVCRDCHAMWQQ